ncbi:hypothetical protein ACFQZZ_33200 [Nocardia sp. GCM10030253]|uniref:hypothetical protein n=1 Tax=Nocardia sp. GCM10030253 TaxID=3273404 RepID=UPI0036331E72
MPSERVAFRAVPPLDHELESRRRAPATALGTVAQEQLDRWFGFLAAQLKTVRLSRGQALCLCDVLGSTLIDALWLLNPGQLLAAEIEDAAEDGYGEKWDIDTDELAALCASWNPGQGLAVVDAVRRFRLAPGDDFDASLVQVGLARHRDPL